MGNEVGRAYSGRTRKGDSGGERRKGCGGDQTGGTKGLTHNRGLKKQRMQGGMRQVG